MVRSSAALLAVGLTVSTPVALDVTFSGVVANTCSLALSTPGILALSSDGTKLGSDQIGGVGAIVLVVSIGSNTITVGTPAWASQPSGYANTGEQMQVSYSGASGLSSVNQGWGSSSTSFTVGMLVSATALTVQNRVTNAAGFAQGTYQTKTVLTCS